MTERNMLRNRKKGELKDLIDNQTKLIFQTAKNVISVEDTLPVQNLQEDLMLLEEEYNRPKSYPKKRPAERVVCNIQHKCAIRRALITLKENSNDSAKEPGIRNGLLAKCREERRRAKITRNCMLCDAARNARSR